MKNRFPQTLNELRLDEADPKAAVLVIPWSILTTMSRSEYFALLRGWRDSYEVAQSRQITRAEEMNRFKQLLAEVNLDAF